MSNDSEPLWPPTVTPCECSEPGWCPRHQCWKPPAWHLLCRRQQAYFEAWERGEGPGQNLSSAAEASSGETAQSSETSNTVPSGPNQFQRAWNLSKAVVRHVADRGRQVDDATFEARLAICRDCPSCDVANMICRDPSCGCFLNVKARWQSEDCPLLKWPQSYTDPSVKEL